MPGTGVRLTVTPTHCHHTTQSHQLHPILTGGRISGAAMAIPEINTTPAEDFTEQRRTRFAAQVANLAQSA